MMQKLRWGVEAALAWLLWQVFAALPIDAASALGGFIARTIGPRLPVSNRARRNLIRALPEMTPGRREEVVRGMWDNLGRVAAEYPHLTGLRYGPGERVEVEGLPILLAIRDDNQTGLFFSAHIGNWEIGGHGSGRFDLPLHLVYRAANNPYAEWVYRKARSTTKAELIPKGSSGARRVLELMRKGEHLALLADQKMNDGIAVPFFGVPAMTAPAVAQLALRFRCPLVPVHIERVRGAHFRVIVEEPLALPDSGNRHEDVRLVMEAVNRHVEKWVRDHPEQWLWLHQRWPSE